MCLPSLCRRSAFWFGSFLLWAVVLWFLSDGPLPGPDGPKIPGIDKVRHFGYYFGGAGLLSAALFLKRGPDPNWGGVIVVVVLIVSGVGLLDEWHQGWFPERSGNDAGDWLADAYGALAGALVFRRVHQVLL
jgi:VanZ family protein